MDSPEGPSAAHFEHPASVDTFDSKQHARKQDIHMIPESAMLLSRLLEREARKQTVLRQIRPSTIRKPIREIPAVSCAKLLRKGTYKKTFRAPPSSKHRSTALSGRESGTSSFHHGNIVFSSAMYFAELTDSPKQCRDPLQSKACHPTQNPAANCCEMNPFYSIAATFWWCIVSMATVGYGDDYPVTPVGKFIATLTMMSGMLILALPISVIGSNFQHVMKEEVQDAMQKSLDTLSTLEVVQKKKMIEILNGFNILGDGIDIDPDELIALYDVHKTGRLEAEALVQFRRDLEALQKHNLTIALPPMFLQKEEQQKQRLSCASSIAEMRNGHHDPLAKQLEAMEEILEIRLLETEVRFENKLNALVKLVAQMEKKIAILRD
ncbi:hypothetical protein DYB26_001992 [Aphanomyces astaci]|uniref:Potassium channel domain-containing protein n=1 Tax=Aphanomyces astaci TaxID=112090 RepID=A0A418CHC2_APHAT|nr:hypothetical protein DYB26_001992 [Aphanomyces astaci]